jgi:curved DNA-binding protein CbpA
VSIWTTLGVAPTATLAEIKAAFRVRALATHPDHGGESVAFRALRAAYDEACKRRERPRRRR